MIHLTDAPRPGWTFSTPSWVASEAMQAFRDRLAPFEVPRVVLTDAEPTPLQAWPDIPGAGRMGDTISVRLPQRFR